MHPITINHTHTHTHTHTLDKTFLDEWSARRRDLYLTTYNTYNRLTSMGFELAIPASERPQTHALDRAATRCEFRLRLRHYLIIYMMCPWKTIKKFRSNRSSSSDSNQAPVRHKSQAPPLDSTDSGTRCYTEYTAYRAFCNRDKK